MAKVESGKSSKTSERRPPKKKEGSSAPQAMDQGSEESKFNPRMREAYLQKIGVLQRFQALDPAGRAAVLHGIPHVGMRAEALLFLWGNPYSTAGDAKRYAHWYYLGSSFSMAASGNQYRDFGNRVDVYLVNGRVTGWVDYIPETWP